MALLAIQAIGFFSRLHAQVADPVLSVNGVSTPQQVTSVTITEATAGTTINYTTNGTPPTPSSASVASGGTILVPNNTALQVQAFQSATVTSNLITARNSVIGGVSAGDLHTVLLKNDGTVWAWGYNSAGELGNGTTTNSSVPVQVMANSTTPLTGIVAVAAGTRESFAVDSSGNVWAWGYNLDGELGIGLTTNPTYPTQVAGLSGFVSVASANYHTLALRNDGTILAWGANNNGQIGNNSVSAYVTKAVNVSSALGQSSPNFQGAVAIAAGANHSLALDSNGNVWAWGGNAAGQLGNGDSSLASKLIPVPVIYNGSQFSGIVALAAGATNSFALKSDGTVWAWGDNSTGELGNGTTSSTPVATNLTAGEVNGLSSMATVANQFAVGTDGSLHGWRNNASGQLGAGYAAGSATVPIVVNLATPSSYTLVPNEGNQKVNPGSLSSAMTVTVTNGGVPVANSLVDFIVSDGGGLLTTSPSNTVFSQIVQVLTNAAGVATIYFQAPTTGNGEAQIVATDGSSQTTMTFSDNGSTPLAATDSPSMLTWGLIVFGCILVVCAARDPRLRGKTVSL